MENLPENKKIILFDGVCNLCDQAIQFIIKHDKKDIFRFVALQSDLGKDILNYLKIDTSKMDSIILYEPSKAYFYKADAAFEIAREFNGLPYALSYLSVFPKLLTNFAYDYIAKNRYKWYGQKSECLIPTPELTNKFL